MNIIEFEKDLSDGLLWTNEVLDNLGLSLLRNETRIRDVEHKTHYEESGYLLIDVWDSEEYQSGRCYPDFKLSLDVLSDNENNFEAEWVLYEDDTEEEEIGRFKSNTTITYKEEKDKYVYSVHEDIGKLIEQIMQSFDKYIKKLRIDEQKEELVDIADKLIEYYNENVDDLFTDKDAIKIVKYIMDKLDVDIEDL